MAIPIKLQHSQHEAAQGPDGHDGAGHCAYSDDRSFHHGAAGWFAEGLQKHAAIL